MNGLYGLMINLSFKSIVKLPTPDWPLETLSLFAASSWVRWHFITSSMIGCLTSYGTCLMFGFSLVLDREDPPLLKRIFSPPVCSFLLPHLCPNRFSFSKNTLRGLLFFWRIVPNNAVCSLMKTLLHALLHTWYLFYDDWLFLMLRGYFPQCLPA